MPPDDTVDPNENFTWEDLLRQPPHHGKTALLVGDGRKTIGHTIAAGPLGDAQENALVTASMYNDPQKHARAVGELLQIFGAGGALSAGVPWPWGLRFPRRKSPRPPNPEKQDAAAAKRERRARRNKEGM